jgi:hypothetical protein
VRRADNLTSFMCQLSTNSGSLNLLEPSRPVQGLLYLYLFTCNICFIHLRSLQFPEDGHVLWPKLVGAVNDKDCATSWKLDFVYIGQWHGKCITINLNRQCYEIF